MTPARTVTRAVHLTDDHERELMAAGWRLVSDVPRRWRSPEGSEHTPTSALRAAAGDRRRDGVA
jgi:hypothetical protein